MCRRFDPAPDHFARIRKRSQVFAVTRLVAFFVIGSRITTLPSAAATSDESLLLRFRPGRLAARLCRLFPVPIRSVRNAQVQQPLINTRPSI